MVTPYCLKARVTKPEFQSYSRAQPRQFQIHCGHFLISTQLRFQTYNATTQSVHTVRLYSGGLPWMEGALCALLELGVAWAVYLG